MARGRAWGKVLLSRSSRFEYLPNGGESDTDLVLNDTGNSLGARPQLFVQFARRPRYQVRDRQDDIA